MARFSAASLGLFVVLLLSAYLLAYFFSDSLLNHYRIQLERQFNAKASFQDTRLSGTRFEVRGLQLTTRGGASLGRIERLQLSLNPLQGLRHGPGRWVDRVELQGVRMDLLFSPEGRLNWDSVTIPASSPGGSLDSAFRGQIRLQDGFVSFRDQREGDFLANLEALEGTLHWRPDQSWQLVAQALNGGLQLQGESRPGHPVQVDLELQEVALDPYLLHPAVVHTLRLSEARVSGKLQARVPLEDPLATILLGKIDFTASQLFVSQIGQKLQELGLHLRFLGSSLRIENSQVSWMGKRIQLEGEVRQGSRSRSLPWFSLKLRSQPVEIARLRQMLADFPLEKGRFTLDLLAEGHPDAPSLEGRVQAWDLEIAQQKLKEVIADFQLDSNSLHLQKIQVDAGGGQQMQGHGWIFRDQDQKFLLQLSGVPPALDALSPWLARSDSFRATALGSLQDPVVTGEASLSALPGNPLGLEAGNARFWLDSNSALLWNGRLWGGGGEVKVPWTLVDYRQGNVAGQASSSGLHVRVPQGSARVEGATEFSGNFLEGNYRATAYLDRGQFQLPGVPEIQDVRGVVALENGEILVPQLTGRSGNTQAQVTGSYQDGKGRFWAYAPAVDLQDWLPGAPTGVRSLMASASLSGSSLDHFRVASQGPGGSAWAVGQWLSSRPPEWYAQFVDLQVPGQPLNLTGHLATQWQRDRLLYFYGARPTEETSENWMVGRGSLMGQQLSLLENYLHLPGDNLQVASLGGEGRAFPYFGPTQGQTLSPLYRQPESWNAAGTFAWSGSYHLGRSQMDLQLKGRNLDLKELASWFGPLPAPLWWQQYGLSLEEMIVDLDARALGSVAGPQVQGSLRSPWTRLTRNPDQQLQSLALSWRSDLDYQKGRMSLTNLISPQALDSRLLDWGGPQQGPPQPEWLRSRLTLTPNFNWQGWVRAEAFPMAVAGWLTPSWISQQLPSGTLSTSDSQGIQVTGSFYSPQIAGRVSLKDGQFWSGHRYLPIDEAFADFASSPRATSLTRLRLKSEGLTLEGRGNRTREGHLTAQFWADDLPLQTLQDFGVPVSGWNGTVDAALSVLLLGGQSPQAWLALQADQLQAPPGSPFAVERLVFGQIDRQLDGIPFTGPGKGVSFRFEAGEFIVDLPDEAVELVLADRTQSRLSGHGRVSWKAPPGPRQSLISWARSANGPRFGSNGTPLRLVAEKISWASLRELLGLTSDQRQGQLSGSLELLGNYQEQHRTAKPRLTGKPFLALSLQEALLEGPGALWSGFQLVQPFQLTYQVVQGSGWLQLAQGSLQFFRKSGPEGAAIPAGELTAEASLAIMENKGLKKPASSGQEQSARLQLNNLPLENLSFLFPHLSRVGGNVRQLGISHLGPLSQPQTELSVDAQNLVIQGLNITAVRGKGQLRSQDDGKIELDFGRDKEELAFLLGAPNDLSQSLRLQGQALLDFDRVIMMRSSELQPVWGGWSLSERSTFDLKANLNDNQMRILSAMAPTGSKLTGTLKAGLELQGSATRPELTGFLGLDAVTMNHPDLRTPLTGLNSLIRFEKIDLENAEPSPLLSRLTDRNLARFTLQRLDGYLGGQPFRGEGKAELSGLMPTYVKARFDGDELPIRWDGLMDGRANVHLQLDGIPQRSFMGNDEGLIPSLSGTIELPQANFQLPSQATLDRLRAFSGTPGGASGGGGFLYDVDLRIGEDVWANFLSSSVRATGDLKVLPSATGKPAINGELFLSRGVLRIPFYEVNFRIRQGFAFFEGGLIPRLENLEADSTFGQYQVTARIDGTYPDLKLQLVSNPPLADNELRNMVVTGGLPSATNTNALVGTTSQSGNFIVNQGVSFLSNMLAGAVTQGLGRLLFMSEVSFDVMPTSEYVLRLAKSLDPRDRFLITFAQVIGTTRFNQSLTEYGLEWRFQPNLLSRVSMDSLGTARIWFQGVLRF